MLETVHQRLPYLWPLLQLARLNRPIGIYLVLWPSLWALWIAAEGFPGWHLLLVFTLGAVLTRSAGCIINDIADRNFDGQVQRTKQRPLVQGLVTVRQALVFMVILLLAALLLVLTTNNLTLLLAAAATLTAAIYPWMKRYTYLPQVILGLAFAFAIPMAFSAVTGAVPKLAWLMMVANVVWTVAYDTEYAMVDRDDDIQLGLKSSAILFGDMDRLAIGSLQVLFLLIMLNVAVTATLGNYYYAGLAAATLLCIYQQFLIRHRNREGCFAAFLNNHWIGLFLFVGIWLHYLLVP